MIKKAVAFVVAYGVFATSVWSLAMPIEGLPLARAFRRVPLFYRSGSTAFNQAANLAALQSHSGIASSRAASMPRLFSNLAELRAAEAAQSGGGGGATATVGIFGPQQYVRTTGPTNVYTTTVQVPAWVGSPFNLHIQSGEADGTHRVSSATITVNGVAVAVPSDFNQNVFTLDRSVTLTPQTTLVVSLDSKPGSYLRINLLGANLDHTPPLVTLAAPADGSVINTPQAHVDIHYQDLPGTGEPAASGVNTNTLKVLLDGVDRTSLFTKRSDEATADLPASLALAEGVHNLTASVQDNAGNTGQASAQFRVDVTPPSIQILKPTAGSFLNTTTVPVQISFSDNVGVNPASLKVLVNGTDQTALLSVTATGATGVLTSTVTKTNEIVASISDLAGNTSPPASVTFNIDTTPPTLTILHPAAGSRHGSVTVQLSLQYSDDQAIDPSSLQVSVDTNAVTVTAGATSASGSVTLQDGSHTLNASIKDKAGNQTSASSTFSVDTQIPSIHIVQPPPGAALNNATPQIQVTYSDPDLDPTTFKFLVDGNDLTSLFTITSSGASATLQTPLTDGPHTLSASVADLTGNVGPATSPILIDTIKPQVTILSPVGPVNTLINPSASVQYSDSGSGIDANSVHLLVDGTDITSAFSRGGQTATGSLPALAEGNHQFEARVADKAGNLADVQSGFQVDLTPPQLSFASPANNSFTNKPTPSVVLNYTDNLSGVALNSLHVFLQPVNGPRTEITSSFTAGSTQATGTITPALAEGTYHLTAQITDLAGNIGNTDAAFEVDTTPPTYAIQTPGINAFLKTSTPSFQVVYSDNTGGSGVDPNQFALRVDGIDRTKDLTASNTGASGTLQPADALADGSHQVDVTVVDRAGNQAPIVAVPFFVDTIPPTITINVSPSGPVTNSNHPSIAVSYADPGAGTTGSGIDVMSFNLTIDGIDHTTDFTVTPSGATGSPALLDGSHVIVARVSDLAGNPAAPATAALAVDTVPPVISITAPVNGFLTNNNHPAISVTYSDTGSGVNTASFKLTIDGADHTAEFVTTGTGASGSPVAALVDGSHNIVATVSDLAGNISAPATANVTIDTVPPTISITTPSNGSFNNNNRPAIAVTYSDTGSGINTSSFKLTIDGVDHTAEFAATASGASGSPAAVLVDGSHSIVATVSDLAGNTSPPATANVTIDTIAPSISITSPASGSFSKTNHPAIAVAYNDSGSGINTSSFKLTIDGTDHTAEFTATASGASGSPAAALADGSRSIVATVSDQAGNTSSATASVTIDTSLPSISITAPANNSFTNNNRPTIAVTFGDTGSSVSPASFKLTIDGVDHTAELAVTATGASGSLASPLSDGNHAIVATVSDQAGNSSSATTSLTINTVPPQITISQPANQSFTNANSLTVTGTVTASVPISSVTVGGVAASLSGGTFNASVSLGAEGPQTVAVSAIDAAGNAGQATVTVIIDRTPPVVTLATPPQVSKLHPGQINVTATDNLSGVNQVVVSVNSVAIATFTSPPYQTTLTVPAGSNPGDTLTVTAVATDRAGNTGSATPHGVPVAGDNNVIVGQVLNDVDSLPLQLANVQMIATTPAATQTDARGRYSLQASDPHLFLSISATIPATPPAQPTPTTTVEREVFVQQGVGTVPVDARLTPLTKAVTIGSAGGALAAGPISITVPASAVADGTGIQLTQLSGQGLPGLLPLGWSPLAAFDLRSTASLASLSGTVNAFPNVVSYLVTYSPALHAWTMVTPTLQPANGSINFTLPSAGDYALVVPDAATPPVPIPGVGAALTGIPVQALDPAAVSGGSLSPAALPAGGGKATATLGVQSPSFAPSGTVIQANISETFSLASGDTVSEQSRSEDIVLYNALAPANATMGAQFPVTPSRAYSNSQLLTGSVHLDILAGREGVRGQPGGNDPLTISDGTSTLSVPGGALSQDTAISVQTTALENFVPTSTTLNALQEVLLDFSGETLNTPAQLSIAATGLNPNDTFLLAQVQRISGVPHLVAIARAQINAGNLISVASPGLPGVIQGGEYVFYDISSAGGAGFVQGVAATSAGPVQALVSTDSLQIVSITGGDGRYTIPALAGTVNLKATGTTTSIAGTASTQLAAGQTATVNIQLNGVVNTGTVSPADKSLGVDPTGIIIVTSPVPLNPQSILQTNLSLFQGSPAAPGAQVSLLPFVLSTSGTVLTLTPAQNLAAATQYTLQVTGLADMGGGAIVVPTSTFTTRANQPLTFDPNRITFGFPDANGNIHVSAPAGSLPPGTKVLIVDQSNAVVLSITALNDGSLSGDFPGTINDVLQVTATDPTGATSTFTRSQFVAADGSVAVGPGGGTVTGPGGVELRIPSGALDQGVSFKIESFGPDLFPERPDVPGGTFGGGLRITSTSPANFKKEAKLAFPMPPGAPPGSFFQVFRRRHGPNNEVVFEDLDYALPEGQGSTAKVVTASFPYRGLIDLNMLLAEADFQGQAIDTVFDTGPVAAQGLEAAAFVIWTASSLLPGIALGGSVTGRVRYAVPPGGTMPDGTINKTGDTVFVGVANVLVTVDSNPPSHAVIGGATGAMTQPDGSFTFSDPHYNGGTINLIAYDGNGHAVTASAIEAVALTDKTVNDFAGPLLPFYKNVAFADIVVPAPTPPPPTPQISIGFFTEDPTSKLRTPVNGIIASGTNLIIAFKTKGQIPNPPSVRINNTSYATQVDQPSVAGDPNTLDFELSQPFVPSAPGIYTLSVTGLTPFLQTISASKSFFVIAAGTSNNQINVGVAPIIASVIPQAGSIGVPVTTFVQVQFSEPVTNLPGHVSLVPDDGSPPPTLKLSGINYRDGVTVISNLSATDAVASMTIEPSELKYNAHYTLQITSDVVDLDNVADPTKPALHLVQPQDQKPPQVPYDFFTFGPTVLGSTTAFASTRPVVFGNRAYVGVPLVGIFSQLNTYDVSDPTNPQLLPDATTSFAGRPMDLAGEQTAEVINNGALVAVGAGFATSTFPLPSNLWLFDVSTDQITRVGGISVTSSCVNVGQILRVALHGNFAYTSTFPVGINVVDLQQGINEYKAAFNADPRSFAVPVTTDGQGFATDAVVNTIPVKAVNGSNVMLLGIQAGDFLVAGSDPQNPITQTLVVATGRVNGAPIPNPPSFVVADPTQPGQSALLYAGPLQLGTQPGSFALNFGIALALGQINVTDSSGNPVPKPVAVVVGYGLAPDPLNPGQTTPNVLAVVDMSVPSVPKVLSIQGLSQNATDVLLKDNLAIVGEATKTELFDLTDPANPFPAGSINGIGGSLALSGFLYSASFSALPGLHVATLGALAFVKSFVPKIIEVSAADEIFTDVTINYAIVPPDPQITTAEVHIDAQNGGRAATLPGPVSQGSGSVTWPRGAKVAEGVAYLATVHAKSNGAELPTVATRVPLLRVPIIIAPLDRMVRIQVALPDQQLFKDKNGNPIDTYSVNVYLNRNPGGTPDLHISSQDITNAYPNRDTWYTASDGSGTPIQDGSADATRDWVTRKIDEFLQPLGITNPVRMQGYEIGTVLASVASVYVTVISEKDGTILAQKLAGTVPNQGFADIESQVDQGINPTGAVSILNPNITANGGMDFRLMLALFEAQLAMDLGTVKGIIKGFFFGLTNDLTLIWNLVTFPFHFNQGIKDLKAFWGSLVEAVHRMEDLIVQLKQLGFSGLWQLMKLANDFLNQVVQTKDSGLIFQVFGAIGYGFGFVVGIILYIVAQVFLLKGLLISLRVALQPTQVARWGTELSVIGAKWVIMLTDIIRPIADLALTEVQVQRLLFNVVSFLARVVLLFMNTAAAAANAVGKVFYSLTSAIAKPLIRVIAACTPAFMDRFLTWLGAGAQAGSRFIAQMEEAALQRFLEFLGTKLPNESVLVQTVETWLALNHGGLDIANAFRTYDKIVDLVDASRTRLILVEEAAGKDLTDGFVQLMEKTGQGDRVPAVLKIIDDAQFSDGTMEELMKVFNDPAFDMGTATDDEIKGLGYILRDDC